MSDPSTIIEHMFDSAATLSAPEVRTWSGRLASSATELDDAGRVDLIRALEELKCAAEAVQAAVSADFDASQRADQARNGVPRERRGRGVAAQIALARRESPHRGQQHLSLAKILRDELPHTMAAFRAGRITEWKATIVARETACLSLDDRRIVDADLAGNGERIEAMGDAELVAAARERAYQLDAAAYVERRRRAEAERRVTLRPAPDVMSQLSALLPVKHGVAVYAALAGEADRLRASGDPRSRGQIMADTLVDRLLGTAGSTATVTLNVVVSDEVLWGAPGVAHVDGYGPVPGDLVRELAGSTRAWVRRLYARPETGSLVAMDSRSRLLPEGLARLVKLRDRVCRTPWCGAPIRHGDHVTAVADGGETDATNSQGLCAACNHAKQAPGWSARSSPAHRHRVVTTTPTGHVYSSTASPAVTPVFVETRPGLWTLAA